MTSWHGVSTHSMTPEHWIALGRLCATLDGIYLKRRWDARVGWRYDDQSTFSALRDLADTALVEEDGESGWWQVTNAGREFFAELVPEYIARL